MDKLNLLNELDDKELDSLMAYAIPYTNEKKVNIKKKFAQGYDKLMEEKMLTRKRTRITVAVIAAALFCLTTLTVFAATQGAFYGLFRNVDDVSEYVQTPNEQVTSNGITMELSSYLADDSGIAMELVFTWDDGSTFAADTVAIGCIDELFIRASSDEPTVVRGFPEVNINDRRRWVSPQNIVTDGGLAYRSIIMAFHDNGDVDIPLEISVSRLIYNIEARHETAYAALSKIFHWDDVTEVILHNDGDDIYTLRGLFDNRQDAPFPTEHGVEIHSIVFARAVLHIDTDYADAWWQDYMDGVDIAGLLPYNYIVGIRYTSRIEDDGVEYRITAMNLNNNLDPFGMSITDNETGIGYAFFRVSYIDELLNIDSSFEHLAFVNGIDFVISSYNFWDGDWHIQTQFSANRESSHVVLDKAIDTGRPDIVPFLLYADISLFETTITLEVRDADGNINHDIDWLDINYVNRVMASDAFSLRYKNGEEIPLWFMQGGMCCCGIHLYTSGMPMDYEYFTLMNTSQLEAIVINGVAFPVE